MTLRAMLAFSASDFGRNVDEVNHNPLRMTRPRSMQALASVMNESPT